MRRFSSLAFFCSVLAAVAVSVVASKPAVAGAAVVTIDGAPVSGVISRAGHLLVPFRAPMEQVGATVDWSDATQTGTATYSGRELVRVKVGEETAYIDGNAKTLTVAPVLITHLEYVPVEMLPQISNATIAMSSDGATATITNFDLAGIDAAGANAGSIDPKGQILYLWVWLLPISAILVVLVIFATKGSLERRRA
jgi:hypothetical protein